MSLRNNITIDYLKGFEPAIENLFWSGETDFSKQISVGEDIVFTDLGLKGIDTTYVMPQLTLRSSGTSLSATASSTGVEDTMNRRRVVIDTITNTVSGKVLTLQGSNDNSVWTDISSVTIYTTTTWETINFKATYKYYRIATTIVTGAIDFRAYLVETKYDLLFTYKILELIMRNAKTGDDQYKMKADDYRMEYNELLNSGKYTVDTNLDGKPDYEQSINIMTFSR